MRILFARILYVAFCVGGMIGLALLWKYAVDSMSTGFAGGFLCGLTFAVVFGSIAYWFDKREREGR